jgi:hypothetical protein
MLKRQFLYINLDAQNPSTALVKTPSVTAPVGFPTVVSGDTLHLVIVPVTNGAISTAAGDGEYSCSVAIGDLGEVPPYVFSTDFLPSASYGWTGSLNTNTASLLTPLGTTDEIKTFFEVQLVKVVEPDSGSVSTILQAPLTIRNQVIMPE